jgi:hypothetical protein
MPNSWSPMASAYPRLLCENHHRTDNPMGATHGRTPARVGLAPKTVGSTAITQSQSKERP